MKTTVKHLASATFIALLLMVINVKAEGTETKAINSEIETTLGLENWMTDESLWNTNTVYIVEFVKETEGEPELESWMTDAELWNSDFNTVEETEPAPELENWMIDDVIWNTENTEKEPELTVEDWMVNENYWK